MRILIIDDSRSVQKSVAWRLTKRGHQIVATGSDGDEGYLLYQTHMPDLVLLDITMPNKDGRECLKEILSLDKNAKIVMLSALSDSNIMQECLDQGALAFIDKGQIMTENYLEDQIDSILTKLKPAA